MKTPQKVRNSKGWLRLKSNERGDVWESRLRLECNERRGVLGVLAEKIGGRSGARLKAIDHSECKIRQVSRESRTKGRLIIIACMWRISTVFCCRP